MRISINRSFFDIDDEIFEMLFENSTVRMRKDYRRALDTERIRFADFVRLAREAQIPWPLFLSPKPLVVAQINLKQSKLQQGVSKETISLNARGTVCLADVELIVKDLTQKQEFLKKYDVDLSDNPLLGTTKRKSTSEIQDAEKILSILELEASEIRLAKNKKIAVELFIERLEACQVLVSRGGNSVMPQSLNKVKAFSGLTVKDRKIPYIFLASGVQGDLEEPPGRQLFTLALLTAMVACGTFAPVAYSNASLQDSPPREFRIAGEMLMPRSYLSDRKLDSLEEIRLIADELKVTPSAVVVRATYCSLISREVGNDFLSLLEEEFRNRDKPRMGNPSKVTAVAKYAGREFSIRLLRVLDTNIISTKDFLRVATLNKLTESDLSDFRGRLR